MLQGRLKVLELEELVGNRISSSSSTVRTSLVVMEVHHQLHLPVEEMTLEVVDNKTSESAHIVLCRTCIVFLYLLLVVPNRRSVCVLKLL